MCVCIIIWVIFNFIVIISYLTTNFSCLCGRYTSKIVWAHQNLCQAKLNLLGVKTQIRKCIYYNLIINPNPVKDSFGVPMVFIIILNYFYILNSKKLKKKKRKRNYFYIFSFSQFLSLLFF